MDTTPRHQDPQQGYARVAQAVVGDVGRVGKSGADALLPGGGPGADRTSKARMIAHVRDAWPYPELRDALFRRMVPSVAGPDGKTYPARNGLANWENLIKEAFPMGYPEPAPLLAPVMGADVGGVQGPMPAGVGGFSPAPLGGEQAF